MVMRVQHCLILGMSVLMLLWLESCGSKSDDDSSSAPTFTTVYTKIFSKDGSGGCASGACHNADTDEQKNGPLFATQAEAYKSIYKTTQKTDFPNWDKVPTGCETAELVSPGFPGKSLLLGSLDKATGDAFATGCTPGFSVHVAGGTNLSADDITMIKNWITAGAKND